MKKLCSLFVLLLPPRLMRSIWTSLAVALLSVGGSPQLSAQTNITIPWEDVDKTGAVASDVAASSPADTQAAVAPRAPRQGIISAGTSFAGYTADNASLAFGTNDLSFFAWIGPDDFTPASNKPLVTKFTGNLGLKVWLLTTGVVRVEIGNGSNFSSYRFDTTAALSATDGDIQLLTGTLDADGNMVVKLNGIAVGDPVAISAASAQTRTSTGALYWLSDASTHHAATLSECGLVNGLLTDAQITAMVRNATAVGLGLTTYQHLVPSDSLGIGIFEDVSGNNNHAVLGATGISTVIPIDLPADAPAQALVGDGATGSFVRTLLNDQSPGTDEFALSWRFQTDGGIHSLVLATEAAVSTIPGLFRITYGASTSIMRVDVFGATTNDYNRWEAPSSLLSNLAGKTRHVLVVRNATGNPSIYLGSAGLVYDITNLGAFTSDGTAPTWQADVPGNYIVKQAGSEITSSIELLNTAPTLADFEYRVRNGRWAPKFAAGDKMPVYTSDFTVDTNGFMSGDTSVVTGGINTDDDGTGTPPSDGWLRTRRDTASGSLSAFKSLAMARGQQHRLTGQVYNPQLGNKTITLMVYGAAGTYTHNVTHTAPPGLSNFDFIFAHTALGAGLGFWLRDMTSNPEGDALYYKALDVTSTGLTTALDLQDGGGYQPKNPRAENGSTHWTMSTTGIKWAAPANNGKRISITTTYTHDQISATAATTLHGTLPDNYAIKEVQLLRTTAFDAGTTLNIGVVGDPDQFLAAEPLDGSSAYIQADSLRLAAKSSTVVTPIYLQKNQATTQGAVTVTVILERAF